MVALASVDDPYMWVGDIHLEVRLEQDKMWPPVTIGVGADGTEGPIAPADARGDDVNAGGFDRRGGGL